MSDTQELTVTITPDDLTRLRKLLKKENDDAAVRSAIRMTTSLLEDFHAGAEIVIRNRDGSLQTLRIRDGNGGWLKRSKKLIRR